MLSRTFASSQEVLSGHAAQPEGSVHYQHRDLRHGGLLEFQTLSLPQGSHL